MLHSFAPMPAPPWPQLGLHVIAKPIGPVCNLRCAYCFYLDKESLYGQGEDWRMSDRTLDAFVRQYIEAQPEAVDVIDFAFQGGEPTLLGIDFFRRVIELQKEHRPPDKQIQNALQTNGLLLDDRWCEFLRANNFLVGLSIDGPIDLHDKYRRDKQDRGTFERVAATMQRLSRHGVEFNALTCVNRHNGDHGRRVYQFLRDAGVEFIQFIPIVDRIEGAKPQAANDHSVRPEQFGRFLIEVFDEWVGRDVGQVFVRDFDQALSAWVSAAGSEGRCAAGSEGRCAGANLCVYAKHCGRAVAIEHNGDLYSCDHFVDLPHKLGNIHDTPIRELANSPEQEQFGRDKHQKLPDVCRRCRWLFICNGACPKDRFVGSAAGSEGRSADGQSGLNYLCPGYKAFFQHIDPTMRAMTAEVQAGRPAAGVMHRLRAERQRAREEAVAAGPVRRNAPCPCGSGKKFKNCCS